MVLNSLGFSLALYIKKPTSQEGLVSDYECISQHGRLTT